MRRRELSVRTRHIQENNDGQEGDDKERHASRARRKKPAGPPALRCAHVLGTASSGGPGSQEGMGDAFIKLLQSPLVAELVAVAATAALAALAEHGFTSGEAAARGQARRQGGQGGRKGRRGSSRPSARQRDRRDPRRAALRPAQKRKPRASDVAHDLERQIARIDARRHGWFPRSASRRREPAGLARPQSTTALPEPGA